jgi:NADPH:quinone reductase-like Zn-dependent oxidoreductase
MATHIGYLLADPPRVWEELMAFLAAQGIRPVVGATFPFHEMPEAHRLMESRSSTGKTVVRMRSMAHMA